MDIKKKFRKFVFSSKSFRETNVWMFNNPDACADYNICESTFYLYDTEDLDYPNIDGFERISKYPYTAVEYYIDNSTFEVTYYFYHKDKEEFIEETSSETPYISKLEDRMGGSFFENFYEIDKIDFEDWKKIYLRTQYAFKKLNESNNYPNNVKKAFIKFITKDDYEQFNSFNRKNQYRYEQELEDPSIIEDDEKYYINELYLLDLRPDLDVYVLKHSEIENDGDVGKSYFAYKNGEFVYAGDFIVDLDDMKIVDYCDESKPFRDYGEGMYSGCATLDDYLRDIDNNDFMGLEGIYKNLDFYDYNKWKKIKDRSQQSFVKMNESKDDSFINWLETKLQRKIGKRIGSGMSGIVYELDNSRIIKLTDVKVAELYKILNKDIKGFAKIYQIGWIYPPKRFISPNRHSVRISKSPFVEIEAKKEKNTKIGYIIMERVDTSVLKKIEEVMRILNDFVFSERGIERLPEDFKSWVKEYNNNFTITGSVTLGIINRLIEKNHIKLVQFLKETYTGLLPEILYEIIDCLVSIKDYYPNWDDVHAGQFGRNKKGELVAFDIGDDTHNIYSKKMDILPKPKNIIRENNILKKFKDFI